MLAFMKAAQKPHGGCTFLTCDYFLLFLLSQLFHDLTFRDLIELKNKLVFLMASEFLLFLYSSFPDSFSLLCIIT